MLRSFVRGGGSPTIQNQALLIGLDTLAVAPAAVVMDVCYPGWCFPVALRGLGERRDEAVEMQEEVGGEGG